MSRSLAAILHRMDTDPCQGFRLRDIRCNDQGQGEQVVLQSLHRFWLQQLCASLGNHHGIDDNLFPAELSNLLAHKTDDARIKQHASLQSIHSKV